MAARAERSCSRARMAAMTSAKAWLCAVPASRDGSGRPHAGAGPGRARGGQAPRRAVAHCDYHVRPPGFVAIPAFAAQSSAEIPARLSALELPGHFPSRFAPGTVNTASALPGPGDGFKENASAPIMGAQNEDFQRWGGHARARRIWGLWPWGAPAFTPVQRLGHLCDRTMARAGAG